MAVTKMWAKSILYNKGLLPMSFYFSYCIYLVHLCLWCVGNRRKKRKRRKRVHEKKIFLDRGPQNMLKMWFYKFYHQNFICIVQCCIVKNVCFTFAKWKWRELLKKKQKEISLSTTISYLYCLPMYIVQYKYIIRINKKMFSFRACI